MLISFQINKILNQLKVHLKKRYYLEHDSLNSLVYFMYNIKAREMNLLKKTQKLDPIFDGGYAP